MVTAPRPPIEVGESIGDRLAAANHAHRDAHEVFLATAKRRRELVLEAVDGGMSYGAVAKILGTSTQRVIALVATAARG